MIIMRGEQGTDEWHEMRLGIPTASNFDRIVTASGGMSSQADQYCNECVAEWITGESASDFAGNTDTERGHLFEPDARAEFEFQTDIEVHQVAFVYKDKKKLVGCSPDGLIQLSPRKHAGVEIKCPRATIHVSYLVGGAIPKKYLPQVQGSMWICGADHWHFVSYHQNYDPLIVRVERDEKFSKVLDRTVPLFIEKMLEKRNNPKFIEMREMRLEAA